MSPVTRIAAFAALLAVSAVPLEAAESTVRSGPERVHLLELFTSEGCSSCPPADRFFSTLRTSPRLWKDFVPVAFHVDYWDHLGWKDRLASAASTARQRACAAVWGSGTVYTPGFVLDGREWRGRGLPGLPAPVGNAGVLSAILRDTGEISVTFQPAAKSGGRWEAHAALLGLGLSSDVKAGENSGRKLQHDFVALAHGSAAMSVSGDVARATWKLPDAPSAAALAVWINAAGGTEPVQAAGGAL